MYDWEKLGQVFDPQQVSGGSWMREYAQAPSALLLDDIVRIYFSCRPRSDNEKQYVSYSGFVDLEKSNLFQIRRIASQPILPLGGVGEFDEFGTYPVSVIRNGSEIWAYYAGWTRCQSVPFNVAIGLAKSSDGGETFTKLGRGPILSYSLNEPFIISGPKIRRFQDRWYLFYIAGRRWIEADGKFEPVYKIRMAHSSNGVDWIKANKDLIPSRIEEDEAQASPDVFFANGIYHMFFCYRYSRNFRSGSHGYRIGYASSKDLESWTRDDEKAGMPLSEDGWDSQDISYPHVFQVDGEFYMAYLGNNVGRCGFGLARLRGRLE